ncbi:uncharacterized protein LOC106070049 isoform X1 [Biomphalaria glabrata]|uniref:Uncharacterized protein LOC106070049 isoform X1 n=1 Tax=Biomphalaria glabrata TaxID=6526 RepID=A0A9U8EFS9_BIOGL|nr:uncharacterized protein LOC106070049 isoform X1 [Biomphalaria glabrata]XP_055868590.1 uncharacterized protein LOC106070049 isoform X1 [Biomphalaria glabrata]XP_055868592.1 uncharacterized protein LOC106070049 isoform X1 [Biomphalaria glabrata]XP_055868593.1 uncharacterized protein LOC106070049 isoform X1 [Biomphalaria glabrata]
MPSYCCIIGCSNTSSKNKEIGFFGIPKVITRQGSSCEEITMKRRIAWLKAINRIDFTLNFVKGKKWIKVCGNHFKKGKPAYVQNVNDPDWIPNLKLGYDPEHKSIRYELPNQRKAKNALRSSRQAQYSEMNEQEIVAAQLKQEFPLYHESVQEKDHQELKQDFLLHPEGIIKVERLEADEPQLCEELAPTLPLGDDRNFTQHLVTEIKREVLLSSLLSEPSATDIIFQNLNQEQFTLQHHTNDNER